jgi:hypothetical protein
LVQMQAGGLVSFEKLGSDLGKDVKLFVCNSHEVEGLSNQVVESTTVDTTKSLVDEITEFFGL